MTSTPTTEEMDRVRFELKDNVLAVGAWPFVDVRHVYSIIQTNVQSSSTAATSSATTVSAAGPATITVADATGLAVGYKLAIDLDDQYETVTIKSVSGNVIGANFRKAHSGTYPVELESALTMFRKLLFDLSRLRDEINSARDTLGVKAADDAQMYGGKDEDNREMALRGSQHRLQMDLARMCGLGEYFRGASGHGGGSFETY